MFNDKFSPKNLINKIQINTSCPLTLAVFISFFNALISIIALKSF